MKSTQLCARALQAYRMALARVSECDPDMGLGQIWVSGCATISIRHEAMAWEVPHDRARAAVRLIRRLDLATDIELIDALETFPEVFLDLLERRSPTGGSVQLTGRRWLDRHGLRSPARSADTLAA